MKSMMKKTLSVIIALAMILVPMSVFAAAGDPIAVPSYEYCIYSGDMVTVGAGETIYFEISTEGSDATYDFVVEGTGDFDVTICTEDGAGAYLDGTPVSAVNGKVETTIAGYASTYYYCAFAITNNSAESVDYTCTIAFPQGSQSNPYPVTLAVGGTVNVTVPAYAQYYVSATLPEQYVDYQLTITGNTGFGIAEGYMPTWDNNGTYVGTVASYWGPASVCILNNTDVEQTYTLALDNMPLGAQSNPDALPVNETVTKDLVNQEYWYTWTAEEDGTFTFEIDNALCADGWTYNLQHNDNVYNFSTGWGESDKNVCEVAVVAGDTILLGVSIPTYYPEIDYYDIYTPASGTVVFTTTFSTGDDNQGGEDIGGDKGEEGGDDVNYAESGEYLVVGDNTVVVDGGYEYTIYTFEPTEEGEYTFTSDNSVMGIVSNNGMWVTVESVADAVNSNEFSWECTAVGQSIWVAVQAETNIANITITRAELDTSDEIPWVDYENMVTPEAFTYEGDADKLVYVDAEDDVDDSMNVYYNDEDGYYHYGSEDGPIIYVNLDESMMSIVSLVGNGKLVGANYDENGEVSELVDCTAAIMEYIACADAVETADGTLTLYPLTDDLVVMYIACGDYMGWYGENGWLELDTADAWMFACYYELDETADDGNNDNTGDNVGDNTNDNAGDNAGDNNTGNVADPEIPNTDSKAFGVAIAMMATVAALGATVVTTKKSKRVK